MPRSVSVVFAPGNAIPWSVVQITSVSSRSPRASISSSTAPTPGVERAGAGVERRHVAARLGRVGQVRRRRDVAVLAVRRPEELAVGLEEADRQEERLVDRAQHVDRDGGDVGGPRRRDLHHLVVADHVRLLRDVLLADQHRVVARGAERVDEVPLVVVQRPAAVGQAEHPVAVGVPAGEQARAAGRAGGGGAERLPEQHALLRERLDPRRAHGGAHRLDVPAGVVRVEVQDVRRPAAHAGPPASTARASWA